MNLELEVEAISFNGMVISADELAEALTDDKHFYHFSNDGQAIYIERFEACALGKLIHK